MKSSHANKASIKYNGKVIADNVTLANRFWTRLSGYMFRKTPHVAGILFEPAGAIQTTFMQFNLDVVFLSEQNEILKLVREMRPWRHAWSTSKAKKVLELPTGSLPHQVKVGDFIQIAIGGEH